MSTTNTINPIRHGGDRSFLPIDALPEAIMRHRDYLTAIAPADRRFVEFAYCFTQTRGRIRNTTAARLKRIAAAIRVTVTTRPPWYSRPTLGTSLIPLPEHEGDPSAQ